MKDRQAQQHRNGNHAGKGTPLAKILIGSHDLGLGDLPSNMGGLLSGWDFYWMSGSYTAADWTETLENSGTWAMGASGMVATTGAADGNAIMAQLKRAKTPTANKLMLAHMRATIADVTNTGFVFGLVNTTADWFSAEGTHSAAFLKAKGAATMVGRSKDGTNGSSTSTLLTGVNSTEYDFTVIYDGFNSLIWYGCKASSAVWDPSNFTSKSTNLPTGSLRMSLYYENNEAAANTMTVDRLVWGAMK